MNIRQREGESLHSYISCFNAATLEVQNLDLSMMTITMKSRLQKSSFLFFLQKKPLWDFAEMLARAEKYANTEEAFMAHGPPSVQKDEKVEEPHPKTQMVGDAGRGCKKSRTLPHHRSQTP